MPVRTLKGMDVTDKNNEYYQPWARDPAEQGDVQNGGDQGSGLAKPQDVPPVGMDLSRYAEEEKLPRAPLIDGDRLKANSARVAKKLRSTASSFAAWTIKIGEKADIPARVEAMEIPRRSKNLAKRSGTAAAVATRAAAQGTAKASKASASKSREVWQKMALGDKVSKLGSEAGRGLSDIADKTKSGLGQVARAGKDSLEETAGKLRPAPREEVSIAPPPSGLEQLLAREEESISSAAASAPNPADLPLFSAEPQVASVEKPEDGRPENPAAPPSVAAPAPVITEVAAAAEAKAPGQPAADTVPPPETPPAAPSGPVMAEVAAFAPTSGPAPQPSPTVVEERPAIALAQAVPPYQVVNRPPAAAPHANAAAPVAPAGAFWRPGGRTMALAGVTLALLLGTSFWLGNRYGGGLTKADVETIVGDYITANPQVIPAALEAQRNSEIAKAIDSVRPALEKPYAGAWGGNADGDVTLVVFTDYACGFCRASLPDIDRLIREDKRLKVVYRELPIISRESRNAALMALAAARQGKYDAFHHAMFAQSSLSPGAIIAAAEKAGVSLDGSGDATADEAVFQRELESNLALATQLQLNATPTWVIGDQLLQGQVGYQALQGAVAKARTKKSV